MKFTGISQIHSVVKRLMLVNFIRSIGQGLMVVELALYLDALGWSTAAIGSVLAAGGLLGVVLAPVIGVYSDRLGRRPFVLISELVTAGCALVGVLTTNPIFLSIAITLSGFGKADAGSPSPCAPAEQAWMASYVPTAERGRVYSLNNALSFFGMGVGAVLAGAASFLNTGGSPYRLLFCYILGASLITASILFTIPGGEAENRLGNKKEGGRIEEKKILHEENAAVLKLAAINILNGIAIGLTGPMMSYWFSAKFGASHAQIGSTLAITFFMTGVTSILQARLSHKHGTIRSIVFLRFIGSLLLILMPLLSSYALVSVIYMLRTSLNRGTQGAQQALSVSLTRNQRSGFASSINLFSMRLPTSIGPYITGYLFGLGSLSLPFYIASCLQLSFTYLYGRLFSSYDIRMKSHASSG